MTCSICGKGTVPGAMLCRPCKAALKRARQFTVQALPGAPVVVRGAGDRRSSDAVSRPSRRGSAGERNQRVALAALAVALFAGAAFVGGRGLAAARAEAPPPALVALALRSPLPPPAFVPATRDEIAPAPRTVPARRTATAPPATSTVPDTGPVDRASPPAIALAQAPELRAPATPAAAASAPDRWQAVSDALARCAEEGGLGGFFCDQRVRFNACDGHWGRVPQCPAPSLPANPR